MSQAWVKVFSSEQVYLVEILKGLLQEEQIEAISINKTDSMHTHLNLGEIEVFVHEQHVMKAKHLISKAAF